MSLYATLVDATLSCPECGANCSTSWQFYFGSKHDLPEYRIGDSIHWEQESFGDPSMTKVSAVAYSNDDVVCFECGIEDILASVEISNGVIVGLEFLQRGYSIPETLYVGAERIPYLNTNKTKQG